MVLKMKIAVEGCAHGELELIYDTIKGIEQKEGIKVDLLLCCGDFQATRNLNDLQTMAVPKKYRSMGTFYKYFSGQLTAPILTIFVGGNHEASNHLQELPYGGWVAPNIYYLGYAGVVRINGIRIAGISGIFKSGDFLRGHHEYPPYTEQTMRSVYHIRQLEVFRLKQLSGTINIFMSHDWPRGIYNYGDKAQLLRFKPHFNDDIEREQLGNRPCEELLNELQPEYWFAAHLHCKFSAIVPHIDESIEKQSSIQSTERNEKVTKFLALDKCLPKRRFLQVLDIDCPLQYAEKDLCLEYDAEWLAILCTTNNLLSVRNSISYMPGPQRGLQNERFNYTPNSEELQEVYQKLNNDLTIPINFHRTVIPFIPSDETKSYSQPSAFINPQCATFCNKLGIDDPLSLVLASNGIDLVYADTLNSSDDEIKVEDALCTETSLVVESSSEVNVINDKQTNPLKRKSINMHETANTGNANKLENESLYSPTAQSPANSINEQQISTLSINDICTHINLPRVPKFKRRNQAIYDKS